MSSAQRSFIDALPFIGLCILCVIFPPLLIVLVFIIPIYIMIVGFNADEKRKKRAEEARDEAKQERKDTYSQYLDSDDWQRKRYVVMERDNCKCVHCGAPATQVHHRKYAKFSIGREPIEWLESVCSNCHSHKHGRE